MTDKERMIYLHVLAIREIMETNPEWSGYLSISIMDKTGSIMIHNRNYDLDRDDPIDLYVTQGTPQGRPDWQVEELKRM